MRPIEPIHKPLQWVVERSQRATRIPPQKWNEHYPQLKFLFEQGHTLDQIQILVATDGFTPSFSQLVKQFGKWEFRRYNVEETKAVDDYANINQDNADIHTSPVSPEPTQTTESESRQSKRRQSTSSGPSFNHSLRHKHEHKKLRRHTTAAKPSTPLYGPGHPDTDDHTSSAGLLRDLESPDAKADSKMDPLESFDYWASQGDVEGPQVVDASQDAGSLSWGALFNFKRTADFLLALGCGRAAFPLYVVLLKRLKQTSGAPEWMRRHVYTALARSAGDPAQREIIRREISNANNDGSNDSEWQFLAMIISSGDSAITSTDAAKTLAKDIHSFLSASYYGSLTPQILGLGIMHRLESLRLKISPGSTLFEWTTDPLVLARIDKGRILHYIGWCRTNLDSNLVTTLQSVNRMRTLASSQDVQSTCSVWLFSFLWQRYQLEIVSLQGDLPLWARDLEMSMGLSSSEMLIVVVDMLMGDALPLDTMDQITDVEPLIDLARDKASLFLRNNDWAVTQFARCAAARILPDPRQSLSPSSYGINHPATYFFADLNITVRHLIQPPLLEQPHPHMVESEPVAMRRQILPTIAATLSSSGSSSYRRFRKIRHEIAQSARLNDGPGANPSRFSWDSDRFSAMSIASLSTALASSLDLRSLAPTVNSFRTSLLEVQV